ncbi:hypothetical protein [Acidocella sp.]|uniref:hypothetical protein n=1 Tax=Acidocella sp. TaxID=50710 RepID=UPI0017B296D5|nr:hypothetical protein [Acidocella sp.]NNM57891.1 hypothetical protein [Acidocella sp.]
MVESRTCEDERHHAPLAEILEALGEEFHELGRFTDHFQASLSPALLRVANDPDCHRNVQTLDLLSQRLSALSKYVLTIGRLLPEDWRVNSQTALHHITLSDLAYRLQGAPVPDELSRQSGELEMF